MFKKNILPIVGSLVIGYVLNVALGNAQSLSVFQPEAGIFPPTIYTGWILPVACHEDQNANKVRNTQGLKLGYTDLCSSLPRSRNAILNYIFWGGVTFGSWKVVGYLLLKKRKQRVLSDVVSEKSKGE